MKALFVEIAEIANKKEVEVRGAALVGACAARYVAAQIAVLRNTSGPLFSGALEPYQKRFEFYATMEDELEDRLTSRKQSCRNEHGDNINIANAVLFPAIATFLEASLGTVKASALSSRIVPKYNPANRLHHVLHLSELSSALTHFTHHITPEPWGHLIGPVVGLFLGIYGEHTKAQTLDPISEIARLCDQLDELDEQLKILVVGVYRMPQKWGAGINTRAPLPEEEALAAVNAKLV